MYQKAFILRPQVPCRVWTLGTKAGGGAKGQDLGHHFFFFFFFFFFFKNDILLSFPSRTEDLTHNVRD